MKNRDLFKMMCSGYISYFKGGNPEAYPFKKTILMHHSMDPYQYAVYKGSLMKEVKNEIEKGINVVSRQSFIVRVHSTEKSNDEGATGIYNSSNLFCNIAFPEAKLTVEESKHMTRETVLKAGIRRFKEILSEEIRLSAQLPEDKRIARLLDVVKSYSSKFSKVAELIMQSKGPVFVYSNFVYYGVEAMAIVMELFGYTPLFGKPSFPQKYSRGNYFVWKGEADENEIIKAKELFNSKENINGDILRIMFGTQTVMEGVDFKNVRQVHILDPWWNDSRVQQIVARGIRLCSHKDLPPNERYVDVFIHISSLGSSQTLFEAIVRKVDIEGKEYQSKVKFIKKIENPEEKRPGLWVYREVYYDPIKEELRTTSRTFLASDIVSFQKSGDPQLVKAFGNYKNLDRISIQEYMYNLAVNKLALNRQFERAIKEVSIDCSLNKNGNIVRLNEFYTPSVVEGTYKMHYENYSTGDTFTRIGLPEIFTMKEILDNIAFKSKDYEFIKNGSEKIKLNKSLIISEDIKCGQKPYSFKNVPGNIVNWTLNNKLIPQLMNLSFTDIKKYFVDIERGIVPSVDPDLRKKFELFKKQDNTLQKEAIIQKLLDRNLGDESAWQLYSLKELKQILNSLN